MADSNNEIFTFIIGMESVIVKPIVLAKTIGKFSIENNALSPLIAPMIDVACLCLSVSYGNRFSSDPTNEIKRYN